MGWGLLAVGLLMLLAKRGTAAPAPREERTREPAATPPGDGGTVPTPAGAGMYGVPVPMNQAEVDAGILLARGELDTDFSKGEGIYNAHRAEFDPSPNPLPPKLIGAIMWRESGGRDAAATTLGEVGYMQLTPDEVTAAGGGNPHSMKDAIRMAQILYSKAVKAHPQAHAEDEAVVAMLSRSIGSGATRWLLSVVPPAGVAPLSAHVLDWLMQRPTRPPGIHQTDKKFAQRIARSVLRAIRADSAGMFPASGKLTLL